jgi:hypothetical protein
LDELVRICQPGGCIVLTIKTTLWDAGFKARVGELVAAGEVAVAEQTEPYISMPGETGTVPSLALVLKRTGLTGLEKESSTDVCRPASGRWPCLRSSPLQ